MKNRRTGLSALGLAICVLVPEVVGAGIPVEKTIDLRTGSRAGSYSLLFCSRHSAGAGPDVGHAFVVWVAEDPARCFSSAEAFGYYPVKDDATGMLKAVVGPVPGELRRDIVEGREMTSILEVRLDESAYRAAERARDRWESSHQYRLGLSDCASFLITVAESAGLRAPSRLWAPTPFEVIRQLSKLNGATDPAPGQEGASGPAEEDNTGSSGGLYGQMAQAEAARLTMDRMRALALALENYRERHGGFPATASARGEPTSPVGAILGELSGNGVAGLSAVDGWGHQILWNGDGTRYALYAPGADGQEDGALRWLGPSESWNTDIIYANGRFLTWPCDVPDSPDPDRPCFVMDTANASVFSIKKPLHLGQPSVVADIEASLGAGLMDLLTGFAQNVIIDGAAAGGPNPYQAGLTVVVTYLQRKADELFDPVTILPLAGGCALSPGQKEPSLIVDPKKPTVLPVVVLDFLKVRANGAPVEPRRYGDGLGLWINGGFSRPERLAERELLSSGQLRSLRGDRSYLVFPRVPLDLRNYTQLCKKCRLADGGYGFVIGAGTRYGAYGRPGGGQEDSVAVELGAKRKNGASTLLAGSPWTDEATATQNALGTTAYVEDFAQDPGFTSLAPLYAYWDSARGNYYVKTRDDLSHKYWAYSPAFGPFDPTKGEVIVQLDMMIENQNWGTYPGVRFFGVEPTEISAPCVFSVSNGNADNNRQLIQVRSCLDRENAYKTPQWSVKNRVWYTVALRTRSGGKRADIVIKRRSNGQVIGEWSNVNFQTSAFSWLGVGYYNKPDYGSDWAPIRIDNISIRLAKGTSRRTAEGTKNAIHLKLTSRNFTENDDLDAACRAEFGPGSHLADWQDVKAAWATHGRDLPDLLGPMRESGCPLTAGSWVSLDSCRAYRTASSASPPRSGPKR